MPGRWQLPLPQPPRLAGLGPAAAARGGPPPPPPATIDLLLGPSFRRVAAPATTSSVRALPQIPVTARPAARRMVVSITDAAEVARVAAGMATPPDGADPVRRPGAGEGHPGHPAGGADGAPAALHGSRPRRRVGAPAGGVAAVAASLAVVGCFGAGALVAHGTGSRSQPTAGPAAGTPSRVATGAELVPVAPSAQFTASGQGPASTLSFHIDAPWTLRYQVQCPGATLSTASFSVVTSAATLAGIDTSVIGSASGSRSGLPPVTVAVVVAVPSGCTWVVDAGRSAKG